MKSDYDLTRTYYNPVEYWNNRGEPNTEADAPLSSFERELFRPFLEQAGSVLEIGPGVGRLFPLYTSNECVATIDISRNYADRAGAMASSMDICVNPYYLDDALDKFPFQNFEFEVGIASHVLMHIPFENIVHTMTELSRCCRKIMVVSAFHRFWPRKGSEFDPKWHCFRHDYEAICKEISCSFESYKLLSESEDGGAFSFEFGLL